jgi:acylphosphatase
MVHRPRPGKAFGVRAGDDGTRVVRLTAWVDGWVQGVGFRYWVRLKASELGLAGSATNLEDGRVEVVAEGSESGCRRLLAELGSGATPGRVTRLTQRWSVAKGDMSGFVER